MSNPITRYAIARENGFFKVEQVRLGHTYCGTVTDRLLKFYQLTRTAFTCSQCRTFSEDKDSRCPLRGEGNNDLYWNVDLAYLCL